MTAKPCVESSCSAQALRPKYFMGEEDFFPLGGIRAMTNNKGQVEILLVEDSALDALVVQASFKKVEVPNRVHVVGNGERALAFLHRGVEFADAPRPDLILLDLELPEVSGLEVLSAIKQTEHPAGNPRDRLNSLGGRFGRFPGVRFASELLSQQTTQYRRFHRDCANNRKALASPHPRSTTGRR